MTEKRFTLEYEAIVDNETLADDGGRQLYWTVEYIQLEKLVELLNSLNDENEQLKKENQRLHTECRRKLLKVMEKEYGDNDD